jgi:hypothetical protein
MILGCLPVLGCGQVTIGDGDFLCGTTPPYCPPQQSCGGDGRCHEGTVDPAPSSPIVHVGTYALLVSGTEGHYLRTDIGGDGTTVQVGWDQVGAYEQWTVTQAAPNIVAIRCKLNGLYVTAGGSSPRAPLSSVGTAIGDAQQFQMFERDDGTIGIFSVMSGHYVATDATANGDAFADRVGPAAAQGFTLTAVTGM